MSTLLSQVRHWLLDKLVSPVRAAWQSLSKWFRDLLRPATARDRLDRPACPDRAPTTGLGAARLRAAVPPGAGPRVAMVAEATPATPPGPPQLATAQFREGLAGESPKPAPGGVKESGAKDTHASGAASRSPASQDRDLATRWHLLGAELADGLGPLHQATSLDAKATSYVEGLQLLVPLMKAAEPQVGTLARDAGRGALPVQAVREVLLQSVLPILDNLHRGRQALESEPTPTPALGAVRTLCAKISGQFHLLLAALGVTARTPLGQRFDPTEQEAVAQTRDDRTPGGHVSVVYLPGFWLGTELLRPAQVGVVR